MAVEHILKDIYDRNFLYTIPFDPATLRGTVMGILGRLRNETAIAEVVRMGGVALRVCPESCQTAAQLRAESPRQLRGWLATLIRGG